MVSDISNLAFPSSYPFLIKLIEERSRYKELKIILHTIPPQTSMNRLDTSFLFNHCYYRLRDLMMDESSLVAVRKMPNRLSKQRVKNEEKKREKAGHANDKERSPQNTKHWQKRRQKMRGA